MKHLNRFLLSLFFMWIFYSSAVAQSFTGIYPASSFLKGTNGSLLQEVKSGYEEDGSPYYPEKYKEAIFVLNDGKGYSGIRARINLMENQLLFLAENGAEMMSTSPVKIVIFRDSSNRKAPTEVIFQNEFPSIDQQTGISYYQVLDTGNVKLLQYRKVTYLDKKGYLTETITRVYQETDTYYLFSEKKELSGLRKEKIL